MNRFVSSSRTLVALTLVLSACLAPAQSPLKPKTLRVNGVELTYIEKGRGEPVIFLHGFLLDYRSWTGQVEAFSRRFHALAYSKRYVYPHHPPDDYSGPNVAADIEDLAALVRALKLGRVHVVGHSGGAGLAMLFARRHPELVRTIVLGEGPPPHPDDATDTAHIFGGAAGSATPPAFVTESLAAYERGDTEEALRLFADGVLGPGHAPAPAIVHQMATDNAWQFKTLGVPDHSVPPFLCKDAANIRVPVLVIVGDSSPALFRRSAEQMQRCRPQTEEAILPHASHGLEFENPEKFNAIVLEFLTRRR